MRKILFYVFISVIFTSLLESSCSKKGYLPHKKRPKKDCGCGSFGLQQQKTVSYE